MFIIGEKGSFFFFFLVWKYTFCFCNPVSWCLGCKYFKSLFLVSLNTISNWGRKCPETVLFAPQKRLTPEKGRWYFHHPGTVALNHSCVSARFFASGFCPNTDQHILLPDPPTWGTGVPHCECYREGDSSHVELNLDQCLQCMCSRGWQNPKINSASHLSQQDEFFL